MNKKLLVAAAASIVASAHAAAPAQPKLVVGIVVQDLQSEYVSLLRENFADRGFNLLIDQGVVLSSVDFGSPLDPTAATAVLYTGAAPSVNGIPADEVYDRNTLSGVPVFTDASNPGVYTSQSLSPAALGVSTIVDEARIAGSGVNFAYSIAADPGIALAMAGHAGNCAIWLNNANSSWATSSFYSEQPTTLAMRNRSKPLSHRIDTMAWTPLLAPDAYFMLPETVVKYPFRHVFGQKGAKKTMAFRNSPRLNDEITSFAIDNIIALKLGSHQAPDMISVAYTLEPYAWGRTPDSRYELIDSYYRLDRNLNELFAAIDSAVGLENTVIFLAGTPAAARVRRDDERWHLPYGEFSTLRATSLLNLYLIAKFGNGDWVQGCHNGHIFLNHRLAEQSNISVDLLSDETAAFLERMEGVSRAYPIHEIVESRSPKAAALRNNISLSHAGDVMFAVLPGWQIVDDANHRDRTEKVERASAPIATAFILAPGVAPRKIDSPVDARSIAPTITRLMRIRSPSGAGTPGLDLE